MPIRYAVISQAMKGIDPSKVKLQREKRRRPLSEPLAMNPPTRSMRRISTTA